LQRDSAGGSHDEEAGCIVLEQELTAEAKHVKKPKTLAGPRVTRRAVIASAA
jgi:hypothetical protein